MKKNQKGFTLIELLSVITLLLIILLISYPNFSNMTNNEQDRYDQSIKILTENAAKIYTNNNKEEINEKINESKGKYCLPLGKIAAYDYIESSIEDLKGNNISMKKCIYISKIVNKDNKIIYNYELSNDEVSDNIDYLPPIITLKNKENSHIECKLNMYNEKITEDVFNKNCDILVLDDSKMNFELGTYNFKLETSINGDIKILSYQAIDSYNNKSKILKIKLYNLTN